MGLWEFSVTVEGIKRCEGRTLRIANSEAHSMSEIYCGGEIMVGLTFSLKRLVLNSKESIFLSRQVM